MVKNLSVALLNHDFKGLVSVTSTETMEVEVQELELVLLSAFVHLSDILSCNAHLSRNVIPEQVDDVTRTIGVENSLEMQSEWLFSHLSVPSEINLLSKASLLPEDRH